MKIKFNSVSNKFNLILIFLLINLVGSSYAGINGYHTPSLLVNFCQNAFNQQLIFPAMDFKRKKVNAEFEISAQHNDVSVDEAYYVYEMQAFNVYVPIALYSEFWKIITNKTSLDIEFVEKNTKNDKYPYVMYLINLNKVIFIEKR